MNVTTRQALATAAADMEDREAAREVERFLDGECHMVKNEDGHVCGVHGSLWTPAGCMHRLVSAEVSEHRQWQFENYGANRDVPDGTGPDSGWLDCVVDVAQSAYTGSIKARQITEIFREDWDYPKDGSPEAQAAARAQCTWARMTREELAEALELADEDLLYGELIQLSALAMQWAERVRERKVVQR